MIPPPHLGNNAVESLPCGDEANARRVRSVVIVDDMAMNLKLLEAQCRSLGMSEIRCFRSGREAIRHLKSVWGVPGVRMPDVILSDLSMPEMDGVAMARVVRRTWPDIPLIAVTAEVEPERKFDLTLFRVTLAKPLATETLREAIEALATDSLDGAES